MESKVNAPLGHSGRSNRFPLRARGLNQPRKEHSREVVMKLRRLGNSGLKVSEVGLGCNNFGMRIDQAATQAVVDAAIEAGITLFDTADVYGGTKSEEF